MKLYEEFIKNHNLVDRLYDMAHFFGLDDNNPEKRTIINKFFYYNLGNSEYVELIAKYFEDKKKRCTNNIELYFNINKLITDLDYLKQYILFDNEE